MMDRVKKGLIAVLVLTLAAIFFALGYWQLDRAREMTANENKVIVVDERVYQLSDLARSDEIIPVESFGKFVNISGQIIATYKAPNQIAADKKVSDWELALIKLDSKSAILVLRGYWKDSGISDIDLGDETLNVTGTIYPRQIQDRALNTGAQISRLDSSLLTSTTDLQLYDGFIAATSEFRETGEIMRPRITPEMPETEFNGYYWQHISYVVIWWLMAVLVLWAPFYKRREVSPPADLSPEVQ
jgi:cytochrome oxidase assembly protein ShyY1